jgi:hypothetical protein
VATLERTDASFTAGAPAERGPGGARARCARLAWQDDVPDAAIVRRVLIRPRGEAAVGDRQLRRVVEERDVTIQGRRPQRALRLAALTHRVVGDELRLGLGSDVKKIGGWIVEATSR